MSPVIPAVAEDRSSQEGVPARCYLRTRPVRIHAYDECRGQCLACSWSSRTPVCAVAVALAQDQEPVDSALAFPADPPTPAQITAARNYVLRIPDAAQQGYAEHHLLWCLMGQPPGCGPSLRAYGLSLAAGAHLQATIDAQLRLPPPPPPPKRRRRQ